MNVEKAFFLKGGWEGWTQVELTLFLLDRGYDVLREEAIYVNRNERVDFLINSTFPLYDNIAPIAIELKCQRAIASSENSFIESVQADIKKLQTLDKKRYYRIILALVVTQDVYDLLSKNNFHSWVHPNKGMAYCWHAVLN